MSVAGSLGVPVAASSLLLHGDEEEESDSPREDFPAQRCPVITCRPAGVLAILVAFVMAVGAVRSARLGGGQGASLRHFAPAAVERKFYDAAGAYWQAPGKGISTSELWSGCEHPHLATCGEYCCCEQGFYWKSPKTLYQSAKSTLRKKAMGIAVGVVTTGTMAGLEAKTIRAAEEVARGLGKSAMKTMLAKAQTCVPGTDVPEEVRQALSDGDRIPGSDSWMTCAPLNANTHTCGDFCCCAGGFKWNGDSEACVEA